MKNTRKEHKNTYLGLKRCISVRRLGMCLILKPWSAPRVCLPTVHSFGGGGGHMTPSTSSESLSSSRFPHVGPLGRWAGPLPCLRHCPRQHPRPSLLLSGFVCCPSVTYGHELLLLTAAVGGAVVVVMVVVSIVVVVVVVVTSL
jgi:hypothetical protein